MSYMHIKNLDKNKLLLLFRECYAMEKVHGSSAWISWNENKLGFFAGGQSHEKFMSLFNHSHITEYFQKLGLEKIMVFGEIYGGKLQKMSDTYGNEMKFIVFDIQLNEQWLSVPDMDKMATELGLEVVPYEKVSTDSAALNVERDRPSVVAIRRGMGLDKLREGVVLRPLAEMTDCFGERVIAKHKGDKFAERLNPPKIEDSADKLIVLENANSIANEWCVMHRLEHVINHLEADNEKLTMKDMQKVIKAMIEDIFREAQGEIVESKEARNAISKKTVELFKQYINVN